MANIQYSYQANKHTTWVVIISMLLMVFISSGYCQSVNKQAVQVELVSLQHASNEFRSSRLFGQKLKHTIIYNIFYLYKDNITACLIRYSRNVKMRLNEAVKRSFFYNTQALFIMQVKTIPEKSEEYIFSL